MQAIEHPVAAQKQVQLYLKRDDLIHPHIQGNKWHKLKYNLAQARIEQHDTLLTFGGPYSNHIYAVAAAGKVFGFNTIGVIRGDHHLQLSPTLNWAQGHDMQLKFVSRQQYQNKDEPSFTQALWQQYGPFYTLPEGGSNQYAVTGCREILTEFDRDFDYICTAVGTGGTMAGLVTGLQSHQTALGFVVLKGMHGLLDDIGQWVNDASRLNQCQLNHEYHFGGYAKTSPVLIDFIIQFYQHYQIRLDPVYTGKMLYGVLDLIAQDFFQKNTTIIVLHSGGLQGLCGFPALAKKLAYDIDAMDRIIYGAEREKPPLEE